MSFNLENYTTGCIISNLASEWINKQLWDEFQFTNNIL